MNPGGVKGPGHNRLPAVWHDSGQPRGMPVALSFANATLQGPGRFISTGFHTISVVFSRPAVYECLVTPSESQQNDDWELARPHRYTESCFRDPLLM